MMSPSGVPSGVLLTCICGVGLHITRLPYHCPRCNVAIVGFRTIKELSAAWFKDAPP